MRPASITTRSSFRGRHCRSRPVVPPRCVSCTNSYLRSGFCGGDARNNCDFARWNSRVPVTVSLPVLFLRQVFRWESPTGRKFQYCVFNFMFHVSTSMSLQLIIGGSIGLVYFDPRTLHLSPYRPTLHLVPWGNRPSPVLIEETISDLQCAASCLDAGDKHTT